MVAPLLFAQKKKMKCSQPTHLSTTNAKEGKGENGENGNGSCIL
jgi:hypothetical protein